MKHIYFFALILFPLPSLAAIIMQLRTFACQNPDFITENHLPLPVQTFLQFNQSYKQYKATMLHPGMTFIKETVFSDRKLESVRYSTSKKIRAYSIHNQFEYYIQNRIQIMLLKN